jgi:hypothetical protein
MKSLIQIYGRLCSCISKVGVSFSSTQVRRPYSRLSFITQECIVTEASTTLHISPVDTNNPTLVLQTRHVRGQIHNWFCFVSRALCGHDRSADAQNMVLEGSTGSSRLPLNHPHAPGLRLLRLDPRQQQSGRDAHTGARGGDVRAVQERTQAAANQLRSAL